MTDTRDTLAEAAAKIGERAIARLVMLFPHVPPEQLLCPQHGDELVYAHNGRRVYECGCIIIQ